MKVILGFLIFAMANITYASTIKCAAAIITDKGISPLSPIAVSFDEDTSSVKLYEIKGQVYNLEFGTSGFYVNDKLLSFDSFNVCAKRMAHYCEAFGTTKLESGSYLAVADTANKVLISCYVIEKL